MIRLSTLAAALGLTAALVVLLRLLDRLTDEALSRVERAPELKLQRMVVMSKERSVQAARGLVRAGQAAAAVILVLYAYLPLLFSLFPLTREWTATLLEWLLAPVQAVARGAAAFAPDLAFIIVIAVLVGLLLRATRMVFVEIQRGALRIPGFYPDWAEPTWQLARLLIVAFTAVIIFPYLPGAGSPAFKGLSVFVGVLLSLGSGSAISNSVAGAIMTYMRPFAVGDRVEIAGTSGDVVEKTLLVTRVRTIKNEEVTIPNSLILGAHIVNYSAGGRAGGLILHTEVTIGYDAPWRKVHELLIGAAKATEGLRGEPEPFVLQRALGDFSVRYEINAYTDRPAESAVLYSRLHANIQDAFSAAGIEIMSPNFYVRRDGPASTIPRR